MKEILYSWFRGLRYKKRFDPDQVPPTEVRKWKIDTYAIVNEVNQEKRKNIFDECRVLLFLLSCVTNFCR